MYARCGSLEDSRRVFDGLEETTVVSWNSIIKAYAQSKEKDVALELFAILLDQGLEPGARTFVAVLGACSGLAAKGDIVSVERAMAFHSEICRRGLLEINEFLVSSLLDLYAKSGALIDARRVFDKVPRHRASSWNVMILGYAESDRGELALELFSLMQSEDVEVDSRTLSSAFLACSSLAAREDGQVVQGKLVKMVALERGMAIHRLLKLLNQETNVFVGSALINMYASCGSMEDASRVFEEASERDLALWTDLFLGYVLNEEGEATLQAFSRMLRTGGVLPDSRSIIAALRACSSLGTESQRLGEQEAKVKWLETGIALHVLIEELGLDANIFVANTQLDMYAKCGSMDDAYMVFDRMPRHTSVSWTCLISGYVENQENGLCLKYFETMQAEGFAPDARAYLPALTACVRLAEKENEEAVCQGHAKVVVKLVSLERGMAIHSQARRSGDESNIFVATLLIDLFAKCGSFRDADRAFDAAKYQGVAVWNSMIMALVQGGECKSALDLFQEMLQQQLEPNSRTFVAALSACSSLGASTTKEKKKTKNNGSNNEKRWLETGMTLHARAAVMGLDRDIFVANTLIDMYCKCQCLEMARQVFERIQRRSIVSWNAIINGCVQAGEYRAALDLFHGLQQGSGSSSREPRPNSQTFAAALNACARLASLDTGRDIHRSIHDTGIVLGCTSSDRILLANSLVTFYGKCGSMAEAEEVFEWIQQQQLFVPVLTWNNLLEGYSHCGDARSALETFKRMTNTRGIAPDGTTYLWLLNACRHSGLVEDGRRCFELMSRKHGIVPGLEHYNCVVDLLGRAGFVKESMEVVRSMAVEADATLWRTLLNACIECKDWENAVLAFQNLQNLGVNESETCIILVTK